MSSQHANQFFATPDPDQPSVMTYWRRYEPGLMVPWPRGARYGPQLPWPRGRSPRELLRSARWSAEYFRPWLARVEAAIRADPDAAAALFSRSLVRCQVCGRRLTDPVSRRIGKGPDCRISGEPAESVQYA